jgi:RHS repeat-associated protein
MDQLVRLDNRSEGRSFFHLDVLRSTVGLTDAAGGAKQSIFYDAWGNERERIGASANNFTFTGHELDEETGLIYAKARFYDPDIGRFLTQDSFLGDASNAPSLHRYQYAHSRPTFWTDPSGRAPGDLWDPRSYDWDLLGQGVREGAAATAVSVLDFLGGASSAFLVNLSFGVAPAPEPPSPSLAFRLGQVTGDVGAIAWGFGEFGLGTSGQLGSLTLDATGVGLVVGIPGHVVSGALQVAGAGHVATGVLSLSKHAGDLVDEFGGTGKGRVVRESPSGEEAVPKPAQKADTGSTPTTEPVTPRPSQSGKNSGTDPNAKRLTGSASDGSTVLPGDAAPVSPRLRDAKTGRFVADPANPPSPHEFTDAQRRAAWKKLAEDPSSPLDAQQRAQIEERGWRGPQRVNPTTGEIETMELSHEPVPLREGGMEVVPRWPEEHAAVDPHRHLKKR